MKNKYKKINWNGVLFIIGQCIVFASGSLALFLDMILKNSWGWIIWIPIFSIGVLISLRALKPKRELKSRIEGK